MSSTSLFSPLKVGSLSLGHRVVMAPLTRLRNTDDNIPTPLTTSYYAQRASVPGTLIIAEGTWVSFKAAGYPNSPGMWSPAQIAAWKATTDAIHAKGSFVFSQLAAFGRGADPDILKTLGIEHVGFGTATIPGQKSPHRVLTLEELKVYADDFVVAAKNAIAAGFDGVELHGANGYFLDQSIQDVSNDRTDELGGSISNRTRYIVEVTKAVAAAIGPEKVGIRLSPYNDFQGMLMKDPVPQFMDVVKALKPLGLAFLHLVESRVKGHLLEDSVIETIEPFVDEYLDGNEDGVVLLAGGFTNQSARQAVDEQYKGKNVGIVFGRHFISNPDLPYRLEHGIELTRYDRDTFYAGGETGFTDYPFSKQWIEKVGA